MDKDLFRIIIFAIGLAVILGMIAWSYIQHEKLKHSDGDLDDLSPDSSGEEHSELGYNENDYEVSELDQELDDYNHNHSVSEKYQDPIDSKPAAPAMKKLSIIQFSIVSDREEGFNGTELFEVLDDAGLEYGNLQIFERLDARRLVDYGVASMVKPGIFPSTNLAAFHSPGIVFFMQPSKLDNSVAVFDDFIRTFKFVASKLGGEMWDHQRQPLTEETIAQIRLSLSS